MVPLTNAMNGLQSSIEAAGTRFHRPHLSGQGLTGEDRRWMELRSTPQNPRRGKMVKKYPHLIPVTNIYGNFELSHEYPIAPSGFPLFKRGASPPLPVVPPPSTGGKRAKTPLWEFRMLWFLQALDPVVVVRYGLSASAHKGLIWVHWSCFDGCNSRAELAFGLSSIMVENSSGNGLICADSVSEHVPNGYSETNLSNGNAKVFKIFVGYDPREDLAYEVCRYSLLKRATIPVEIHPIKQSELRNKGLYWRERGTTESTEFSFSRFLTPYLANFDGWAMFVDCDFLYTVDIKELTDLVDEKYAIMCVQHDYKPKETTKMDGAVQTVYPRKNWSSMVLYNCGHPKNKVLTPDLVNSQTGAFLHRFMWLEDHEIGAIPFVWNFLVGHNKVDESDPTTTPKAIHYTSGGPWFEAWKNCDFAHLWLNEKEEYIKESKEEQMAK